MLSEKVCGRTVLLRFGGFCKWLSMPGGTADCGQGGRPTTQPDKVIVAIPGA
jgi:hypothetical protein